METNVSAVASKRATLIINAIIAFVGAFMSSAVNIALPTIGKEFNAEAVLIGWITSSMLLSQAVVLIPVGRFADIYGRKKLFFCGSLLMAVSSFLCAIAGSIMLLIIFRVLQGISAGISIVTSIAVLTSVFPAEERGRVIGISVALTYLGLSLGPYLGGVMTTYLGWRSIFHFTAVFGLISAIIILWKLKGEWADARGEKFDVVGSILFIICVVMIIYGFSELLTKPGMVLVVLGVFVLMAFIWWEMKAASPLIDIALFRKNTVFVFSNLATLINYCAYYAIGFLLSLYLQYIKGLSPQAAGLILVVQPVVMTIIAPFAGRLSDKVEPRIVASCGMAIVFVALGLFIFFTGETAIWHIIITLAVVGLGIGFFSSPNTNAILGSVEKRWLGVASGAVGTMRTSGMTLSMGIVMILFSIYIGDAQITPEYYPAFLTTFKVMFIISAGICFIGIFVQLIGSKR